MKDTDKFILARNHSYWNKMGQNINNYRLELLENFHPDGYKVPCCFARKDEISIGWDVEVRLKDRSKERWVPGKVKSVKKINSEKNEYTVTLTGEEIDEVVITHNLDIRRERKSKYVSNNFPSNLGVYGYLQPILSNYLYPKDLPKIKDLPDIQLYRKGVKRGTSKCDKSYLESIQELLHEENSSVKDLIGNIIYDLNQLKNTHKFISGIGNGSFINLFKKNVRDITDIDARSFRKYLKRYKNRFTGSHIQRHISKINSKESLLKLLTMYETTKEGIFINREFTEITAIYQFTNYLLSDTGIVLDTYVSPILSAIAKFPSRTFGSKIYHNLSIVTFEGNSEDIFLEAPMGGSTQNCQSIILLYKERGHLYEPIMYVKGGIVESILSIDNIPKNKDLDEYERKWKNRVIDQCKTSLGQLNSIIVNEFMDIHTLQTILTRLKLPIINYIYDNYNKVVLIETKASTYIPVTPFEIDIRKNNKFIGEIKRSSYKNCITTLAAIDKLKLGKSYLQEAMLTVLGITNRKKQIQLRINEIVFSNGSYIPLKQDVYESKHTLPVLGNISYFEIDKTISLYGLSNDKRTLYNKQIDFKNRLRSLFFQKSYLLIKEDKSLLEKILNIKYNEIMINYHKREKIIAMIEKPISKIVRLEGVYKDDLEIDKGSIMIIPSIEELSSKELFMKMLKLFIDLLINYSEKDYERFLLINIDINKIKQNINEDEYLLQQSDIDNESYLEYFIRFSEYIRNVGVYNQGLSRSKQIQLNSKKIKQKIILEKTKDYPEILYTLFGRGILVKKEELSDIDILANILLSFVSDQQEINSQIIQSLLDVDDKDNHRIDKDDLLILSNEYKIGFCLVTKQFTKKIYHDIDIVVHEDSFTGELKDSEIVLLYQDDKYLYHLLKKDKISIPIKEITSKRFEKELQNFTG